MTHVGFSMKVWDLAEFMHDKYLEISVKTGWVVQPITRVPFKDLPKENQQVMLELAFKVIKYFKK